MYYSRKVLRACRPIWLFLCTSLAVAPSLACSARARARTLGETYREALSQGTRKEGQAYLDQLRMERPAGFAEPFTPVRRSEESQAYWVEPYFVGDDEAHDGHWMVLVTKGSTWNSDLVLHKGLMTLPGPVTPRQAKKASLLRLSEVVEIIRTYPRRPKIKLAAMSLKLPPPLG